MKALKHGRGGSPIMGLLLKDWLTIRRSARYFLLMTALFSLIPGSWFKLCAAVYAAMLPAYTMSFDERSRWDRFALALPVSRRAIVLSKYAFGAIVIAVVTALSAISGGIFAVARHMPYDPMEPIIILSVGLLAQAVMLPFLFIFGATKGRIAQMTVIALFAGGLSALQIGAGWLDAAMRLLARLTLVMGLGVVALNALSIGFAAAKYRKRSL